MRWGRGRLRPARLRLRRRCWRSIVMTIVAMGVPTMSKVVAETTLNGKEFRSADGSAAPDRMSFYKEAAVSSRFKAQQAGTYRLTVGLIIRGDFDFDPARCQVIFKVDDE